ncbi:MULTISPECIES: uracil-DNA glycosylase family protein [Marinobacter]|uniref:Uracil-DNA glycosylase n=1 Tax=Marinobacter profundi TaxID=2666256 RepID=A0A2G1UPG2_9GAMM|nr:MULTISPECIES: uracil-DNA glycosylase family protein [Marinobacter]MBD3656366.1 uracil-DNA glycosylase family protein [Marinobacter sp.]PHQ16353.1 uracil-DNA glycosylase [Marinobacter profundi]
MANDIQALPFRELVHQVRSCTLCADKLPLGPRPVIQLSEDSKILLVGQAPGRRVHETGLPFNDPSGDRLRQWMGVTRDTFYDETLMAILPMGFCYPGTGKSGDLPPRPECAPAWRELLLERLRCIELTLVIGQYAHAWHLPKPKQPVTANVRNWRRFWPDIVPLPHPSPRNNGWLKQNPWFEAEVVPALQDRVRSILGQAVHSPLR